MPKILLLCVALLMVAGSAHAAGRLTLSVALSKLETALKGSPYGPESIVGSKLKIDDSRGESVCKGKLVWEFSIEENGSNPGEIIQGTVTLRASDGAVCGIGLPYMD